MMTEETITRLRGARHPLQEHVTETTFIANDVDLRSGVLIVTGPNYSGKSVLLKTVALIHILAQMGCFVPCESAILGIADRIFTRVHSHESVVSSTMESSFSIDLQQMGGMFRRCTSNSLLLIDEFGKGKREV